MHDTAILLGRFQPVHAGHLALLQHGLAQAREVIIVLGSAFAARSPKNPFTWQERAAMLRDALPAADRERLRFLPVRDRYDEPAWVQDVRLGVARMLPTPSEQRVALVGHFKDASSNYLRRFPGWALLDLPRQGSMDATAIRDAYWAATPGTVSAALAPLAQDMPPSTLRFLHDFATLPAYAALQEEWRVLRDYRASWAQAPYPGVCHGRCRAALPEPCAAGAPRPGARQGPVGCARRLSGAPRHTVAILPAGTVGRNRLPPGRGHAARRPARGQGV